MRLQNIPLAILAPAVLLLLGCDDAQLADFPQAKVSLEMMIIDNAPHYRVTFEAQEGVKVDKMGIVQYYHDNNNPNRPWEPEMTVIELLPGEQDTYIGRRGYATDVFDAYAYILSDVGYIRSDAQSMVVPGSNIPLIKEARFDFDKPTGCWGTLRIFGENFNPLDNIFSLDYPTRALFPHYPGTSLHSYPDSIVVTGLECEAYGHYKMVLRQYDNPYPFEVDIKGLHIDSISPTTIKIGEPMTIYYSNATPGGNYEFISYISVTLDKDDHHIKLLPMLYDPIITNLTSKVKATDFDRDIGISSDIEYTITRDPWTSWSKFYMGTHSCKVGNYLCTSDGKRLYGYNLDTHWIDFQPKINASTQSPGYSLHSIDDRYAYIWYWSSGTGYLCRYDTQERKWEDITSLTTPAPNVWFEDANTFRALKGNKLFTFHLDTNTWDDAEFLYTSDNSEGVKLTEDSELCGNYKGHVYFGQSDNVYRYPVGKPKDITLVGKPNWPFTQPLTIQNDNFYFFYQNSSFQYPYVYKMPMTSLIEGTNEVTCIGVPGHNPFSNKLNFYETDTHYLVFYGGYIQALNK
jgi:hypothetical protein